MVFVGDEGCNSHVTHSSVTLLTGWNMWLVVLLLKSTKQVDPPRGKTGKLYRKMGYYLTRPRP
jgi:hypothetical protein